MTTPKQQYSQKLTDPRWQKKRLQVLEAAGWRCSACHREDKTLHVHHLRYSGSDPWDTPPAFLECLCELCHAEREQANQEFIEMIREAPTLSILRCQNALGRAAVALSYMPQDSMPPNTYGMLVDAIAAALSRTAREADSTDYTVFIPEPLSPKKKT